MNPSGVMIAIRSYYWQILIHASIAKVSASSNQALFKSHLIIAYNTHVTGLSQGLISGRITEIVSYMVQSCQLP